MPATACSLERSANHYRPNKEGQSVCKNFINVENATVMLHQTRNPEDDVCKEKNVLELRGACWPKWTPMLGEANCQSRRFWWTAVKSEQKEKGQTKVRQISEETISPEVKEANTQEEEWQEYLFFNIESCQNEDQHIANLLTVQGDTGFEMVFKDGIECCLFFCLEW